MFKKDGVIPGTVEIFGQYTGSFFATSLKEFEYIKQYCLLCYKVVKHGILHRSRMQTKGI